MKLAFKRRVPAQRPTAEAIALVAAAAARLDLSKNNALEIAKAEPRGATVYAGQITRLRTPLQLQVRVRTRTAAKLAYRNAKRIVPTGG